MSATKFDYTKFDDLLRNHKFVALEEFFRNNVHKLDQNDPCSLYHHIIFYALYLTANDFNILFKILDKHIGKIPIIIQWKVNDDAGEEFYLLRTNFAEPLFLSYEAKRNYSNVTNEYTVYCGTRYITYQCAGCIDIRYKTPIEIIDCIISALDKTEWKIRVPLYTRMKKHIEKQLER
jgi:hypothetical protein